MLVTVIISVEHREPYVSRCIKSVMAQTHRELDIILSGRDGCAEETCVRMSSDYPNITYIPDRGRPSCETLNRAIRRARGEYICFVDSDDRIVPGYLDYLLDLVADGQAPVAMCMPKPYRWGDDEEFLYTEDEYRQEIIDPAAYLSKRRLEGGIEYTSLLCKLFRRDLFDGIRFTGPRFFMDEPELPRLIYKAGSIAVSYLPIYFYTVRKGAVKIKETYSQEMSDTLEGYRKTADMFEGMGEDRLRWYSMEGYLEGCLKLYDLAGEAADSRKIRKDLTARYSRMLKRAKKSPGKDPARMSTLNHYRLFPADWSKKEKRD